MEDVAKGYRKRFPALNKRKNCYICKKFRSIIHWHHAPPISEVIASKLYVPEWFDWPMFPLCPNHHILIHRIYSGNETIESCSYDLQEHQMFDRIIFAGNIAMKQLNESTFGSIG